MTGKTGQCMCGAVSFTARDVVSGYGACHCKMCQRWAGSALLAVTVPVDQMTLTGSENISRIQSSDWAERAWCNKCGTGLWYRVTAPGDHWGGYEIPIGIFDDPNGFEMNREIFIDKKPDAFEFCGDHKTLTQAEVLDLYGIEPTGA